MFNKFELHVKALLTITVLCSVNPSPSMSQDVRTKVQLWKRANTKRSFKQMKLQRLKSSFSQVHD